MDSFPHVSCVQCNQRFITKQDYTCYHCTHSNLKEELTELCEHFTAEPVTQEMSSEVDEVEDEDDENFIDDRSTELLTEDEDTSQESEEEAQATPPQQRKPQTPAPSGTIHGRLWH